MLRRRRKKRRRPDRRWIHGLLRLSKSKTMQRALEVLGAENKRIEIIRQRVIIPHLPKAFHHFRICQISDVHHGPFVDLEYIARVVEMANHLRPDLTVLTGDYVSHNPIYITPCMTALGYLDAAFGVYAVLGNHDYWEDPDLLRQEMKQSGIKELTNMGVTLRKGGGEIYLSGVDDLWSGHPNLEAALAHRNHHSVTILLSHNPDLAEKIPASARVDLVLSGHTHGGQIQIVPGRNTTNPSRYGRKYLSGLVNAPHTQVYVSRGIGVSALPVRVLCPPELTILELECGS